MPRKSDITKKIEAKLDKLVAELEETDRGLLDLNMKRDAISFQILDMRELLDVPKPKKKAPKKAKATEPCHQCPLCGDIIDQDICPKCFPEEK